MGKHLFLALLDHNERVEENHEFWCSEFWPPANSFPLKRIGQNAAILEAFTESIRHFLPDYYDYTFIDGIDECEPAPGIGDIFPGPYYCQYTRFYPAYVRENQAQIKQIIDEEGK